MSWTVEYLPKLGLIESTFVGRVTLEEFKEATIRSVELTTRHNVNLFLVDDSKWEGGASVFDLVALIDSYRDLKLPSASRGAFILPASNTQAEKDVRFFETACRNRSWTARVFTDRENAIAWLTE